MQTDDPWTLGTGQRASDVTAPQQTHPSFVIDRITDVAPLDGTTDDTVPPPLHDVVFGPLPNQTDHPAPKTYAILDGAKITNLPQMLENSGLDHLCLFRGKALEDLGDVAPWLIALEDGNRFTQSLFTQSTAPWHLWDAEGGVILRSHLSLDQLQAHFRKFTKVRDEQGAWLYFRFWEPTWVERFAEVLEPQQLLKLLDGVDVLAAKVEAEFISLRVQ